MTKKEILEVLEKYDDSDTIYNASGAYDSVNLVNGYDYASILRDRDIAWVEGRRDREFSEMEDAQARITIANAKLAKKENRADDFSNNTTVKEYMKKYGLV